MPLVWFSADGFAEDQPVLEPDPSARARVVLDMRLFHRFLASDLVQVDNIIGCFLQGKMVVLHILEASLDMYVTYYIPAHAE